MCRILLIGPFPDPISGVSLANKVVFDILDRNEEYKADIIDTSYPYFDEYVGSFSIKKLLFFLTINIKSYKIFNADIIYMTPGQTFFGISKYILFIFFSTILKKKTIIHVHGNHLGNCYKELFGIKKTILYRLVSKYSKGIVLSESLKSNLTPFLSQDKIYSLPNFAEDYLIEKERKKEINELRIVFLSNLMREKGILILLDSLKELEKKNVFYKAKIAGNIDASLKDVITQKINDLKFTEYIGVVRGEQKKELLFWSNTFVLPTFYKMEGQPISILEALATKNIIITTNHAGISDVITNEVHGYFVEKDNEKSLTNVLFKISKDIKQIEKTAIDNVVYFKKNFTVKIFEEKILKIFNEK